MYSSIASEVGLEVDEDAYKALMGTSQENRREERKEQDVKKKNIRKLTLLEL